MVCITKDPSTLADILDDLECLYQNGAGLALNNYGYYCVEVKNDVVNIKDDLKKARKDALNDAYNKAKALADKTGKKVGALLTIIDETSSVDIAKTDWKRNWFTGKTIPTDDITPEYYELEYAVKLKYALICKD
jgi:hypothetical protein